MGRRLGLVVGVNQYQDDTFQPLQFAENDARALAQWLVNARGGKWSPADVQFVSNGHATRDLVESLVMRLCVTIAEPGDLVLVYVASHAFVDDTSGEGYLALTDTFSRDTRTGLNLFALAREAMTRSRAAHIVFILDSFQNGQLWETRRTSAYDVQPLLGPPLIQGLQQQDNRVLVCSCRGKENAPEMGARDLGLLMYHTIIGMSGPARDAETGTVTLQQLYTYLSNVLGEQQRPQIFGRVPAPFFLIGDAINTSQQTVQDTQSSPFSTQQRRSSIPQPNTVSPLMTQATPYATATVQPPPTFQQEPQRTTSDSMSTSAIDQQRQQQCKYLLSQAQQMLQTQNLSEAIHLIEQALQIDQTNSEGLTLKAQILGTMGQFQDALVIVGQLIGREPNNALVWSMCAVLLANTGQNQDALAAIERSLELDSSNPETYAIKTNIMNSIAIAQSREKEAAKNDLIASDKRRNGPRSFFIGAGLQLVGLLIGLVGTVLPVLQPNLPIWIAFLLEGFGLSLLCVNAARGTYRYGFLRVMMALFISIIPAAILGVSFGFRPAYRKIIFELQAHTSLLLPLIFLAGWLALAALLPPLLAIIGFLSGSITGVRRRAR